MRKEEEEGRVGGWVREGESEKGGGGEGNSHERKEKKREGVQDSF